MKHVKQKISRCRRAAMLTVLAILLSCLPSGRALAWAAGQTFTNVTVVSGGVTMTIGGKISTANETKITVMITSMTATFSSTNRELVFPVRFNDPNDGEIPFDVTSVNLTSKSFSNQAFLQTVTVPEGITMVKGCPDFNYATTLNLPKSYTDIYGAYDFLSRIKKLSTLNVAESDTYPKFFSRNNMLTRSDGTTEELVYVHANVFGNSTTLNVPEGVTALSLTNAIPSTIRSKIKTLNLPSTFNNDLTTFWKQNLSVLTDINVDEDNTTLYSVNGVLCKYNTDGNELLCYPLGKSNASYAVPTDAAAGEGKGVSTVNTYAFYNSKFSNIDLGNVSKLNNQAFYNQPNVITPKITLTIPAQLTDINSGAFYNTKIEKYIVADGNPKYSADEVGVLFENETIIIDGESQIVKVLKTFPQALEIAENETYTIPDDVNIIGKDAFKSAKDFKGKVIIGTGVTTIRDNAFQLSNLHAVEFKEVSQLTVIPQYCFQGCLGLTSIDIPPSVNSIMGNALNSTSLTNATIPETVASVGEGVFQNCKSLTSVTFENDNISRIGNYCFNGCASLETVNFPSNCTEIGMSAFAGCNLTDAEFIPSTITRIERGAFQNNNFTTLNLPDGLTFIGASAFQGNTSLTSIELPDDLASIGEYAFYGCTNLGNEIVIPASVMSVGGNAFANCDVIKVTIEDGSQLVSISNLPFGTKIKEVEFEGTCALSSIGSQAFYNCTELEAFICPSNVTEINERAFASCTKLTEFAFPNAVETIGDMAFDGTTSLEVITFDKNNSNLKSIGNNTFTNCAITEVIFPNSLETISYEAFKQCNGLTTVTLPALIQNVNGGCFNFCPNIENFYVEDLVYPEGATDEEKAALKSQVKYSAVGGYLLTSDKETLVAFPEAKANTKFTLLPPSICKIGNFAFYCCKKLENIVIPNKVTEIMGTRAFGQCTNLKTITFLCDKMIDPAKINQNQADGEVAFDGNTLYGKTIYVRKDLLSDYQNSSFYNVATIIPSFEEDVRTFANWESGKRRVVVDGVDTNPNAEVNEYINVSENVVSMIGTKSKDHTFVLSSSVKHGTETFSVELIGDYAFQNAAADIKEVVVLDYIKYIGANAFITGLAADDPNLTENESTIERIFFVNTKPDTEYETEDKLTSMISTVRFKLKEEDLVNGKDYREFLPGQRIFVKKSMLDDYQHYWPEYAERIDYRIRPLSAATPATRVMNPTETKYDFIKIEAGKKYGTFSREFDVDLGQYAKDKASANESIGSFDIKAFTTGAVADGPGDRHDYPEDNDDYTVPYHLRMYHIGYSEGKDGTYIPNATGALLAVMNDWNGTPSDYYYCIGEDDNGGDRNNDNTDVAGNGTLHRSIESATTTLAANPASGNIYHLKKWVMQGGIFRPVKETEIYLPAHKAWLYYEMDYLKDANASAMTFGFSLDSLSEDTGVEGIGQDNATAASGIYTLTGVKVLKPEGKGIYIVNGKKMIIK